MIRTNGSFHESKDLNVLQIVAINAAATVSLFGFAVALGASWLAALFGAWIAGALVTVCTAAAISSLTQRLDQKATGDPRGPALVPGNVSDPMQLWEADRLMEIDHASTVLGVSEDSGAQWQAAHAPCNLWTGAQSTEAESKNSEHETRPEKSRRAV